MKWKQCNQRGKGNNLINCKMLRLKSNALGIKSTFFAEKIINSFCGMFYDRMKY